MSVENQSFSNAISPDASDAFTDRRNPNVQRNTSGFERRQFSDGHSNLSPAAQELGTAIDQYKLEHCRRYISYEEMLNVITALGYKKS